MITVNGFFPWDNFCIDIDGRKIFIGVVRHSLYTDKDFLIGFYPYTTETYNIKDNKNNKNFIFCIGDFNSYQYDKRRYDNLIHVSTYCFHYYPEFETNNILHGNFLFDGIIVARNDPDKKREMISELTGYNIISASNDNKEHEPKHFKYVKCGKFSSQELNNFYHKSKCSFIFSEKEGECRSAMESLLSGCPIISAKPKKWSYDKTIYNDLPMNGGRAEILTPANSLYADWNSSSVKQTYERYLDTIYKYDREKIRYDAKQFLFRSRLQLIKILHNVVVQHFKVDFLEVIDALKKDKTINSFYAICKEPFDYYESILK